MSSPTLIQDSSVAMGILSSGTSKRNSLDLLKVDEHMLLYLIASLDSWEQWMRRLADLRCSRLRSHMMSEKDSTAGYGFRIPSLALAWTEELRSLMIGLSLTTRHCTPVAPHQRLLSSSQRKSDEK
jgi:hypothetical protein